MVQVGVVSLLHPPQVEMSALNIHPNYEASSYKPFHYLAAIILPSDCDTICGCCVTSPFPNYRSVPRIFSPTTSPPSLFTLFLQYLDPLTTSLKESSLKNVCMEEGG